MTTLHCLLSSSGNGLVVVVREEQEKEGGGAAEALAEREVAELALLELVKPVRI